MLLATMLLSCATTPSGSAEPLAEEPSETHHEEGAHHEEEAHHEEGAHHEEAATGGDHGTHMAHMATTRDAMRAELGAAYDQPVPGLDQADAHRGAELYAQNCSVCHGDAGGGDGPAGVGLQPPASDLTDAHHATFYSDAGRVHVIGHGSPGTAMPAFESILGADGMLDVYAHVLGLRGDAGGSHDEHEAHEEEAHEEEAHDEHEEEAQ